MRKGVLYYLLILLACFFGQPVRAQCIINALANDLLEANTPQAFKDFIRGNPEGMMAYKKYVVNPELRKDVDVLTATANFMTRHPDYLADFPGKFDDILENLKRAGARCRNCTSGKKNLGIPLMDVIIDDLNWAWGTFKGSNVDVQKLFTEMAANAPKADGGAFMFNALRAEARRDATYVGSISKFEYKYLSDGKFEADIYRQIGNDHYLTEFKSFSQSTWEGFSNNADYVKQFLAYFRSEKNFEYVANVGKLNAVENPEKFVRSQFMKIFESNAQELMTRNPAFFTNITYGDDIIDIVSAEQLTNLCKRANFAESSLFNFVKAK